MGEGEKIRSMDNPKRTEVDLVHPGKASQRSRSGKYSVEYVETVAPKKDIHEPASDSGLSDKAQDTLSVSLVIPVLNE